MYIFPNYLFYATFDLCPNLPFPYTINGRYQAAQLTRRVAAVLLILPPILWLYANAPPAYIFHMRVILRQRVFFDFDSDGRGCNLRCILVDIHSELVDLRPLLCYFATLSLSRHISIEDQEIIFGPLQVILGHFENWVCHFFISLIIFCLGVPVRTLLSRHTLIVSKLLTFAKKVSELSKLCLNSI